MPARRVAGAVCLLADRPESPILGDRDGLSGVAAPFRATLSRGLFRLLGTVGGAVATVVLVPRFANEPLVLSAALAAWMALCLYLAMLDRTPRAYAFLLAGYTTSLIGFPAVMVPADVFTIAITRVQEIAIGILAATLVHGLVLPRRVSMRVHARVAAVLDDAERWTRDMRAGASDTVLATDRSKVAADLLELHVLSIHLPFDSAHGVARCRSCVPCMTGCWMY